MHCGFLGKIRSSTADFQRKYYSLFIFVYFKMEINFKHIADAEEGRCNAVFCTIVAVEGLAPRGAGSKMLVFEDGRTQGTVGGGNVEFEVIEMAKKLLQTNGRPVLRTFHLKDHLGMVCGGEVSLYLEPLTRPFPLYIFGAGHVGRAVARYAVDVGFAVHLVDNRPTQFAEVDTNRVTCIEGAYVTVIDTIPFDNRSFFVITTPRHEYDQEVLAKVAGKPHAYVGMMASPIKVKEVRETFLRENILSKALLDTIDMPIGIPIANHTPEEIAISIVAKLIDVKNKHL